MKTKQRVWWFAAILVAMLVTLVSIDAAMAAGLKSRMRDRLPDIVALKAAGAVGENNKGYLERMSAKSRGAEVVAAENTDRKKVYNAIAKQQGTTADLVGSRRARQIADIAGPGEWLQDAKGNWYQK